MNMQLLLILVMSFAIGVITLPILIPILRRLKASQTEREELQSHQAKTGTPTMGGIGILIAYTASTLVAAIIEPMVLPVLILTVGFGLIGFIDDYLKVVLRRSDGLLAWQKLILQFLVTTIFVFYITKFSGISLLMRIPFTNGAMWDIFYFAIPILYFAVIGTVNGTNFTDGLDGLASTVTFIVALFFVAASLHLGGGVELSGMAMAGALLAFLIYNCYPAHVFMGDTGSLALGGFVAGMAYMLQMPLYILIVGLIYLVEVISVILQVGYFKLTHGKRIFRMAPIHHHFELGGWSETKVVTIFAIVTGLMCAVGFIAI